MNNSIPLLSLEQIEELNAMIAGISRENAKSLDDLLSERVELQNSTIMQLYNLTVEEWGKKQKIIDNLCHFSLTMMSTVQFLWGQKGDNEERLSNAELVIDSLNKHIQELGEQNETFKHKINEAEFHIDQIVGEKQKIEDLYRTQSCCDFLNEAEFHVNVPQEKSLLCQHQNNFNEEKSQLIEENNKKMADKQKQIQSLKLSKIELEKKLQELIEENSLAKIEVELAEIAVKDALSYKQASQISSYRSADLNSSYHDEIFASKSHGNFFSGQLDCFSTLNDHHTLEKKNSLMNDMFGVDSKEIQTDNSSPNGHSSYEGSMTLVKESSEEVTSAQNPFKKKPSKIQSSELFNLKTSVISCEEEPKFESLLVKKKKTVSLQCNLTSLPKLSFDYTKNAYEEENNLKTKKIQYSFKKEVEKKKLPQVPKKKETKKRVFVPLSKSEILTPQPLVNKEESKEGVKQNKQVIKTSYSFSNMFNFFTHKLVSERIKVK